MEWVCEKAGINMELAESKIIDDLKAEVWNGEKLWTVERVTPDRLGTAIHSALNERKSKF